MKTNSIQHTILEALNWRYASKRFDPSKKISSDDWKVLEESLRLSASSYGLQPWKFLVIQNPAVRKKLTPASWNQPQVEECSHYVVLCHMKKMDEAYVKRYIEKIIKVRGVPFESLKGYQDVMVQTVQKLSTTPQLLEFWTARQVYIALGAILTTAAMLNIDSCPMEGFDAAQYDEILGLNETPYKAVVAVALGYRGKDDYLDGAKKVRFDHDEVFQEI